MRALAIIVASSILALGAPSAAYAAVPVRTVAPTETFDVGMLRVERFGTAGRSAIVFIPGLFCGTWQWNGQIAALASTHDIYAVTLPGLDGRPPVAENDLMRRVAADLSHLIVSRKLGRPIVVGHSLGGTLAVFFGESYPNAAAGIIAVEGGYPIAPTPQARRKRVEASVRPYERGTPKTIGTIIRDDTVQYTITSKADVADVTHRAAGSDPGAVLAWMRAALILDVTPRLDALRGPLVAIVPFDKVIDPYQGFASFAAKRSAYAAWVAHARDGSVTMIAPSRHFVMFDQPARFNRALVDAVAHIERSAHRDG